MSIKQQSCVEAMKAIQMVYANTTKHDWPDDIWDAICKAIEAAVAEQHKPSRSDIKQEPCERQLKREPDGHMHELIQNGAGVWLGVVGPDSKEICEQAFEEGVTSKEVKPFWFSPQPKRYVATQPKPLTEAQILHRVDTHIGPVSPSYPLNNSDWINFARAIEAEIKASLRSNHDHYGQSLL